MDCLGCKSSSSDKNFIFESKYWKVFLNPEQSYLGRCVVTLKRHCSSLSQLKSEEWIDFVNLVKKLESLLKKAFGATMFNWSCFLNDAYQNNPPNPHVHWHLRPRYKQSVKFANRWFEDPDFSHHYSRDRKEIVDDKMIKKIIDKIR